jgi:hypothetical protein
LSPSIFRCHSSKRRVFYFFHDSRSLI